MIVLIKGVPFMKDYDEIKRVQSFFIDANVPNAVRDFVNANPELVKSRVAFMNVMNGRTNGDVKGLFSKFLDFYLNRINHYMESNTNE